MANYHQLGLDDYIAGLTSLVFINEYGEKYELIKINNDIGILKGDETNWQNVYLVNGYGLDFNIYNDDELLWLNYHFDLNKPLYENLNTSIALSAKSERQGHTYLINDFCPVCLKQCSDFEIHHVVWASEGGSDAPQNQVKICCDCHALETRGSKRYVWAIGGILRSHQLYHFGFDFFFCQRSRSSRYKDRHIKEYNESLYNTLKSICKYWAGYYKKNKKRPDWEYIFNNQKSIWGHTLRYEQRMRFHYFRQVYLGNIPFEYIEKNIFENERII